MLRWVGIGVGVLTVLLIGFIVGLALAPVGFREGSRDIMIILLGIFQLISTFVMIALLFAVLFAVNQISKVARTSVVPRIDEAMVKLNDVLDSTRTLAGNVRDSASTATQATSFVAERAVSPIIRISSLVTGVRTAAVTLARRDAPDDDQVTR